MTYMGDAAHPVIFDDPMFDIIEVGWGSGFLAAIIFCSLVGSEGDGDGHSATVANACGLVLTGNPTDITADPIVRPAIGADGHSNTLQSDQPDAVPVIPPYPSFWSQYPSANAFQLAGLYDYVNSVGKKIPDFSKYYSFVECGITKDGYAEGGDSSIEFGLGLCMVVNLKKFMADFPISSATIDLYQYATGLDVGDPSAETYSWFIIKGKEIDIDSNLLLTVGLPDYTIIDSGFFTASSGNHVGSFTYTPAP